MLHRLKKHKLIAAGGITVVFATVLALIATRDGGPEYEGRTAKYWASELMRDKARSRKALLAIGPDAAVPALAAVVRGKDSRVWVWLEPHRSRLPAWITRRLPSPSRNRFLRESAIEMLYEFGPAAAPAAAELLKAAIATSDFSSGGFFTASIAHGALLRIGDAALPHLTQLLSDGNPKARASAADYIGRIGPGAGESAGALAKLLQDTIPAVREAAVAALARIGPPAREALPALRRMLKLDSGYDRIRVMEALWRIGDEAGDVLPILIRMVANPNDANRARAATLLGEMGPAAKSAVPVLTALTREEFSYTRVKAEEALRQIEPVEHRVPP